MKHFTVDKLDFKIYKRAFIEVSGGSRPRLTLIHAKTNQKFFFKTYSHNPREVWAEALATHMGELIGLSIQKVTIKKHTQALKDVINKHYPGRLPDDWVPIGTLARNIFLKGFEITYGAAIVGSPNTPITLAEVEAKIRARYYAPADILQDYSDMIIFDAFIGNMDRHHENWGVCESKTYKQTVMFGGKQTTEGRYFAPLFDHGSSLMFELSDEDVANFMKDENRLIKYINRAKYTFVLDSTGNKNNIFKIINEEVMANSEWGKRFKKSIKKVIAIDSLDLATLLVQMPILPELQYDQNRRRLLYKSLVLRYNMLKNILEGITNNE